MRSRQLRVMTFDVLMLALSLQDSRDDPGARLNPLSGGARHLPVCFTE